MAPDLRRIECGTSLPLSIGDIARLYRDAMRDKSYQDTPLGRHVAAYLRARHQRLSKASRRGYESSLDKLARHFADKDIDEITRRDIEEYLYDRWGDATPGTYRVNLSITSSFFEWAVGSELINRNPCAGIDRPPKADPQRTVFTTAHRNLILEANEDMRDRVALRLLLDFGLRKGTLQRIRFSDFDHDQRRLTVRLKGGKHRTLPLPDANFWRDLALHMLEVSAEPEHYLMASSRVRFIADHKQVRQRIPDKPMSDSAGMHRWWYACLARAGIVPTGTTKGERMHKARHSAGQHVLDATGDLKLVQKMLGHSTIKTTGDIYVDYDIDQWAERLARALEDRADED